jgi:hypothetical protein
MIGVVTTAKSLLIRVIGTTCLLFGSYSCLVLVCLVANTDYYFLVRTQILSAVSPATKSAPESVRVKPAAVTNADAKSVIVHVVVSVNATKE